jgi:hypothetical protein
MDVATATLVETTATGPSDRKHDRIYTARVTIETTVAINAVDEDDAHLIAESLIPAYQGMETRHGPVWGSIFHIADVKATVHDVKFHMLTDLDE